MQRFSVSLFLCLICIDAMAGVSLPTVDVSGGRISARAAFGEEIPEPKIVRVQTEQKKEEKPVQRSVVARSAKTPTVTTNKIASNDVLIPHRPSSDLWAMNDSPLRMPRMDEISVVRSDSILPEESLDAEKTVKVAKVKQNVVNRDDVYQETLQELKSLRQEIARLSDFQNQNQIALARPTMVRTPISGESKVIPAEKTNDVNVRREIVPMETKADVVARSATMPEPKIVSTNDMARMAPSELKKAFKKTYLSENKHLSTYPVDDRYDVASDMSSSIEGFSAQRDLSEIADGIRPMEIKISFMNGDSGLSRDNYTLLSETASVVVNNPKRAIQIAIPESATHTKDGRKLAARRMAIVEQVLRDTGVAEQRIIPVLSQRDDDVFVLRIISGDLFETLTQQKRNMFGDDVSKKTYTSMSW